jgi:hypothetical protein
MIVLDSFHSHIGIMNDIIDMILRLTFQFLKLQLDRYRILLNIFHKEINYKT